MGPDETSRRRIDVNLDELDRGWTERASAVERDDYEKLKEALHALAAMLVRPRTTEKTRALWEHRKARKLASRPQPETNASPART